MKRTVNMGDNEPDQKTFNLPSETEHLFQVVDVFTMESEIGMKLGLDENTVSVKCEVAIGDELGRTLLQRCSLDETWKGFFATRLFLKAIGEAHKGTGIEIDTDRWIGRQFYAVVKHNGKFANIAEYNFEKSAAIAQHDGPVNPGGVTKAEDIAWEQ
jgi:hypothetical protein